MKKLVAALLSVLVLSGCANSEQDLPKRILTQLQSLPSVKLTAGSNMNKKYYSYYLPRDIGRKDSTALSEVFVKNGYHLVMNFDPNAIITKNYYQDKMEDVSSSFLEPTFQEDDNKYTYTGNYLTNSNEVHNYSLQVIENEANCLLYFDGTIVKLYTYIPKAEVMSSLKAMIRIVSSVDYEEKKILENYSIKDIEQTKVEGIEYIEQNLPSSGYLQELLNGEGSNAGHSGDSTE